MTSILIIHFHSTKNAGDTAQLEATIADLRANFGEIELTVAANYPDEEYLQSLPIKIVTSTSALVGVGQRSVFVSILSFVRALYLIFKNCLTPTRRYPPSSKVNRWQETLSAYRSADLVVSAAGNIFFTMGSFGFPFLCSAQAILPALCYRKPFYVFPQTIGPLNRWWERFVLAKLYSTARLVFARDIKSYELAREIGIPESKLKLNIDQSLRLDFDRAERPPKTLLELGFRENENAIGVTVIPRVIKTLTLDKIDAYYEILARSLSSFAARHDVRIFFFPQVIGPMPNEDDRLAARRVAELMSTPEDQTSLIEDELTFRELSACYGWMDLFLGTRLHSALFSAKSGTATIMIGYLDKSFATAEMIGLQEYVLDLGTLTEENLTLKLDQAWQGREQLGKEIAERISTYQSGTERVGQQILEDFHHGS